MKRKMIGLLLVSMMLVVGLTACGGSEPTTATETEGREMGTASSSEGADQVLRITGEPIRRTWILLRRPTKYR